MRSTKAKMSLSTKLLTLVFLMYPLHISSTIFNPLQMPKGAKVTLPQPATMVMPIDMTVNLGATDRSQALSLLAVGSGSKPIQVRINDLSLKTVKVVNLYPGRRVFYNYTSLSTVKLEASLNGSKINKRSKVQIESNRPLEISY